MSGELNNQQIDDLFNGFGAADPAAGGTYFFPETAPVGTVASFEVEINRALMKQTQKGAMAFITELMILQSTFPERPAGMQVTWMPQMRNATEQATFFSNVKGFLLAAFLSCRPGTTAHEIDKDVMKYVVSEQQPLCGVRLKAQCEVILTQKNKRPFTVARFAPIPGQAFGTKKPTGEPAQAA